jgi:GTPase
MITDEVTVTVEAGAGGNGCLSFRREKFIPRGGPDGGNGGRGGDIVLEARNDVHTLVDFLYRPLFCAKHGQHGKGKNMHGKDAPEVVIRVPVGTLVWDQGGELIVDMREEGMKFLIAKGGRGGRGNTTFATSTQRAPRLAERGEPGEKKTLRLELKLLADVGVVGFPNAGKSTLLSRVTHARPKIADYPFTTLEPQLGVVQLSGERNFVLADVPGLLEGASRGKGLGIRFLKHLERTKVLLHLIELATLENYKELEKRIRVIRGELKAHSPKFQKIPQLLVLSKADAVSGRPVQEWKNRLEKKGQKTFIISAVSGAGLDRLLEGVWDQLVIARKNEAAVRSLPKEKVYQAKARFKVEFQEGVYHVSGPEISKWVAMTNFNNPDAAERFYRILGRMGVIKELKGRGMGEGDIVNCAGEELTFESERLGAHDAG